MAGFPAMKRIANGGAVTALVGFLSSGFIYAGKKAGAAEIEQNKMVKIEDSKANASGDGRQGLSCAPQFDGLECFETIVRTGKHPSTAKASGTENWSWSTGKHPSTAKASGTENWSWSTGKHPRSVNQPSAMKKSEPKNRGLALAPQFDGLHCFETFISKK